MSKDAIQNLIKRYHATADDHKAANKVAEQTHKQIKDLQICATPVHYTLMYEAISEIDPYLANEIQKAIANKSYDNSTAESLFIDLISQYVHPGLPPEEVEGLLNALLEEITSWVSQTKSKEELLTSEIEQVSRENLPLHIAERLDKKILPTLQSFFSDTDSLRKQVQNSAIEITQLKNELKQARAVAKTDELTNIPNRRGFNEIILRTVANADAEMSSFAMIMIDIDYFKAINDKFGHLIGDSVLRYLAKQLHEETKGKDSVARIGGEEFVVLLPNTGYDNAMNVANNLRKKIENNKLKVKNHETTLKLTVSAGVSTYQLGESIESLINRTDQALYQAKNSGRNKVCGVC
ncbi:GGDEF domain-containing protein [Thiomicrorhabdus immobilis]|uniref:diguanylate cyclase n=1 Tax=Thiomicrorhabdus immobilis TaxID=2791037 RepID=A0ABN6CY75_9GAMM|nr:GGDEF domain-containing protein [Thiomicrorhabdus immobilis]BCN94043.1 GGDEF domain-containing protein [Thiomicrorhabdus immobilis]